ncbi:MAG: tetratricopeptide repeat protein [Calditrichaceae bacterium]
MKIKKLLLYNLWLILIFSIAFVGCSSDSTSNKDDGTTISDASVSGWNAFKAGNYQEAIGYFDTALSDNPNEFAAHLGLAWSYSKLGEIATAYDYFDSADDLNISSNDLYAGMAFAELVLGLYDNSIVHASMAISNEANWSFTYNSPSIGIDLDYKDLQLCMAQDYFWLGDFDGSLTEVQKLNASFNADVSTSDGQQALHEEIMRLRGVI